MRSFCPGSTGAWAAGCKRGSIGSAALIDGRTSVAGSERGSSAHCLAEFAAAGHFYGEFLELLNRRIADPAQPAQTITLTPTLITRTTTGKVQIR